MGVRDRRPGLLLVVPIFFSYTTVGLSDLYDVLSLWFLLFFEVYVSAHQRTIIFHLEQSQGIMSIY